MSQLTRPTYLPYFDRIERLSPSCGRSVIRVKIADNMDSTHPARVALITNDFERIRDCYASAREMLERVLTEHFPDTP